MALDLPEAPPPVVAVVPRQAKAPRPRATASAANLRAVPTIIAAPVPVVPTPPIVPPVVAAPIAADGAAATAGAATVAGPGTGSGGEGTGRGSGDAGDGDGGGGTASRWIKGRIGNSDYPRAAEAAGVTGDLTTRYTVGANGRVTGCTVTESSGSAELDQTTCRLVMARYRYKPARDAQGKAVVDVVYEDHRWVIRGDR